MAPPPMEPRPRRRWPLVAGAIMLTVALTAATAAAIVLRPWSSADPGSSADATPAASAQAPSAGAPGLGDPYDEDAGNGGYDVQHYRIDIRFDPATDRLDATTVIMARATHGLTRFNLDFSPLKVESVTVDGAPATATASGVREVELEITPARPIAADAEFTVEVRYGGTPTGDNFPNVYHTEDGAFALGEPESATEWFPCNDHPRDKATFDFAVTVPEGLTGIANGVPRGSTTAAGWTTWRWSEGHPMATYLATLVVGKYRVVADGTAAGLPIYSAVAASLDPSYADAAIARTPEIVEFLVERFGPYPFDAIGAVVTDTADLAFALETQTRPVYSRSFFLNGSVEQKTAVVAHEMAHQWFGDSVSLTRWQEMWLNEGFAEYAQWMWSEHVGVGTARERFDEAYNSGSTLEPPGDASRELFSRSVYRRGAMTVHALRVTVGDETFFKILRGWTQRYRHANATTEDFIGHAEQVSGKPLRPLLQSWLFDLGKPPYPTG